MGFQVAQKTGNDFSPVKKHAQQENEAIFNPLEGSTGFPAPFIQRLPSCSCGGGCPRCAAVQTKLKIGQPGDKYEQEADDVAESVMHMPESDVPPKPT